jgi:hypothetical protein
MGEAGVMPGCGNDRRLARERQRRHGAFHLRLWPARAPARQLHALWAANYRRPVPSILNRASARWLRQFMGALGEGEVRSGAVTASGLVVPAKRPEQSLIQALSRA